MEENKRNFLVQNGVDVEKGIENTMDFETYNEIPSLTVSNQKDYLDIEKSSFFIFLLLRTIAE